MKPKINSIKKLAGTKFLNMYQIDYTNKLGNEKTWNSVSRVDLNDYEKRIYEKSSSKDAVLIAPFHIKQNKIVLVKQYRVPLNEYIYEIPAGLIDKDEDIQTCVKRELLEETGLNLVKITKVFENIYLTPGITDECADLVFCLCDGEVSSKYLEEDEDLTVHMYAQDEIDELMEKQEKIDMKTLFAIELLRFSGRTLWE